MDKRRGTVLIIITLGFWFIPETLALGVLYWHSPQVHFQPNMTLDLHYVVHGLRQNQEVRVYAEGDLAEYVEITPDHLVGGGEFTALLRFPDTIEKPGSHVIHFVAAEVVQDAGGVGTAIAIRVPFTVFVPYPGKYIDAVLTVADVNIGEYASVNIDGINSGIEDNIVRATLEIYAIDKISTFNLGEIFVASKEKFHFQKKIDTTNYQPGIYKAIGLIEYGLPLRLEADFKIGSLFVELMNHTFWFMRDTLSGFTLVVESRWNNPLDEVYATVSISNASHANISNFKTPSEKLDRWERKNLTGFFDTHGLGKGIYNADITVYYTSGKKSGQTVRREHIAIGEVWWAAHRTALIMGVFLVILFFVIAILSILIFKKRRNFSMYRSKNSSK